MLETGQKQVEALHELLIVSDVVLRDAQGKELLTLRKDSLRRWFSVVVTLEDVSAVSTQPIMLSDLGFKWEARYPSLCPSRSLGAYRSSGYAERLSALPAPSAGDSR